MMSTTIDGYANYPICQIYIVFVYQNIPDPINIYNYCVNDNGKCNITIKQ